jgi:hypothetical protein
VPERLTDWGLPAALSVMVSEAKRLPLAEGVKMTLIEQLPPAATELPQLLVWAKSLAFEPESARLVTLKVALPELVNVIVCAELAVLTDWFPKARLVGETVAPGAVPVPQRATVWEAPLPLSLIVNEAVRVPAAEGLKVTWIKHIARAASDPPQLFD